MKILVIGKGGREHAMVWKLAQSRGVEKIYCAPGNAGIAQIAETVPIPLDNLSALADFAADKKIDLTVVGPELPLTLGIVDVFEEKGLRIFGPDKAAAEIEGSKAFAKDFMQRYHIPTGSFRIFSNHGDALDFVSSASYPLVIKADGLAAGKGTIIVSSPGEAKTAVENIMVEKVFGEAGERLVVEEFLRRRRGHGHGPHRRRAGYSDGIGARSQKDFRWRQGSQYGRHGSLCAHPCNLR